MNKKTNILITGGTGFIGSHLVELLLKKHSNIFIPYIEIHPKSYFSVKKLRKEVNLLKLDLTDRKRTVAVIKKNNIEFIFHLAAQTIVTDALHNPHHTLFNNIISTINILDAVRTNGNVKGIIVASSDKAYGKTKDIYTEDSPLKGDHPYDVSKSSKDLIAQAYYKTYKTPVVITRFGNVYGEGDLHLSRIVPGICEALVENKTLSIRSNGKYIRDYIYVKDVAAGYMHLLHKLDKTIGHAYNFSSSDTLSVVEVVEKAQAAVGTKIRYSIENSAINEIPYQHLNDGKIKKLGWRPRHRFSEEFPKILDWYRAHVFKNRHK